MCWLLTCKIMSRPPGRPDWHVHALLSRSNVLTSCETSMGDLSFGRSFDIKEPGPNPLKTIPHNIAAYMKFYHPVSS